MIDFEHGALRRTGEPELAGFIAHAVMDHRDALAVSFLTGAAALDLVQWNAVLEAEIARRRYRRRDLDRAVRRLRALVDEGAGTPLHGWILSFIDEVAWQASRDTGVVGSSGYEKKASERLFSMMVGMLTAASFAVLYGEKIGEPQLALIYEPFEPFVPLASLG